MATLEELKARGLPDQCATVDNVTGKLIVLKLGERGFHDYNLQPDDPQREADSINANLGVTKAQHDAMLAGSMFGWDLPASDPKTYEKRW